MKLIFTYFLDSIKKTPKYYLVSFFWSISNAIITSIIPWILDYIFKMVKNYNIFFVIIVLPILFFALIFIEIRWYISLDKFGGSYISKLSIKCQERILETSELNLKYDEVKHILFSNILDIFRTVGHHLPKITSSIAVVIFSLMFSLILDKRISFFILISFLIGLLITFYSNNSIQNSSSSTNMKIKNFNSHINDFSESINQIKVENLNDYYLNKTKFYIKNFIDSSINENKTVYFYSGIIKQTNIVLRLVFSLILAINVSNNSILNIVIYTIVFNLVMEEANNLEMLLQQVNRSYVCFENIEKILKLNKGQRDNFIDDVKTIDINIKTFCYDGNPILKNVSINLVKGDTVHIRGKNGSGKSTLLKLITNIYEKYDGIIKINNLDINTIKKESLSNQILYLAQEEKYLNETIYDYLRIVTKTEISDIEIDEILDLLNFGSFDLNLDYNGDSLSGGQKKKLSLVKLIILKEKVSLIILDEVDSGLDNETKTLFTNLINDIIKNKNKIIIGIQHTSSSNVNYNKIYNIT